MTDTAWPLPHLPVCAASWVSGVSSCTHPAVWATLLHYKHSKQLTKRAGKGSLCLVYSPSSRPTLFHFDHHIEDNFTYSTAQLEIEVWNNWKVG